MPLPIPYAKWDFATSHRVDHLATLPLTPFGPDFRVAATGGYRKNPGSRRVLSINGVHFRGCAGLQGKTFPTTSGPSHCSERSEPLVSDFSPLRRGSRAEAAPLLN